VTNTRCCIDTVDSPDNEHGVADDDNEDEFLNLMLNVCNLSQRYVDEVQEFSGYKRPIFSNNVFKTSFTNL
jgi:hypothetical protein